MGMAILFNTEDWRRKWVIATKPGDAEGRTATALNEEAFPGIIGSHFVMFVHLPWTTIMAATLELNQY